MTKKTSHYKLSVLKLGKNATFGSCRVCFSLHTLSKIFNLLFSQFKNAATFSSLFAIRKKITLSGSWLCVFFLSMHSQKSAIYSYLIYKNAATLVSVFNQEKTPPWAHCRVWFFYFHAL